MADSLESRLAEIERLQAGLSALGTQSEQAGRDRAATQEQLDEAIHQLKRLEAELAERSPLYPLQAPRLAQPDARA